MAIKNSYKLVQLFWRQLKIGHKIMMPEKLGRGNIMVLLVKQPAGHCRIINVIISVCFNQHALSCVGFHCILITLFIDMSAWGHHDHTTAIIGTCPILVSS